MSELRLSRFAGPGGRTPKLADFGIHYEIPSGLGWVEATDRRRERTRRNRDEDDGVIIKRACVIKSRITGKKTASQAFSPPCRGLACLLFVQLRASIVENDEPHAAPRTKRSNKLLQKFVWFFPPSKMVWWTVSGINWMKQKWCRFFGGCECFQFIAANAGSLAVDAFCHFFFASFLYQIN